MSDQDVEVLLREAQETIKRQQQMLEELTAIPAKVASVVGIKGEQVLLSNGSVVPMPAEKVKAGEMVQVAPTGMVVAKLPFESYGQSGTVVRIEGGVFQVAAEQGVLTIGASRVPVEVGDEVVLDGTGLVIAHKFTRPPQHAFTADTHVGWDDIGGLEEAKLALREAVEMPYTHAALFKHFGKRHPRGVLLHGLPGNGKTMLGKATATAIAKAHGKTTVPGAFIYIKGPELLSKWVGESESMIRGLFEGARKHRARHGYPAVIFIDEADSLLTARGTRTAGGMEHTIVPQFLSEMDGLEESGAIVLLATNRADMLDSAVTRPGRIDRKVYVAPPDLNAVIRIFAIHLKGVPVVGENLPGYGANVLFSDAFPLYQLRTSKGTMVFHVHHAVSGAMVAGLVEQASAKAIHRCVAAKVKTGGVCEGDVDEAFRSVYMEHLRGTHQAELEDYADRHGCTIEAVAKVQGVVQG
jgi:proteasome-associated ATPase